MCEDESETRGILSSTHAIRQTPRSFQGNLLQNSSSCENGRDQEWGREAEL